VRSVYTEECGASYCAGAKLVNAQELNRGDRGYVSDGVHSRAAAVTAVAKRQAQVKYIVTQAGNLVVNGMVASVFSMLAHRFETLPFYVLDWLFHGTFEWAPVKAALYLVLESPALANAEMLVDTFMSLKAPLAPPQHKPALAFASYSV